MDRRRGLWLSVVLAILLVLTLLSVMWRIESDLSKARGDTILSLELALTPQRAAAIVDGWRSMELGETSLVTIARKSIHLDWLLISAYLWLMLALRKLLRHCALFPREEWVKGALSLAPIFAPLLDAAENIGLYLLLMSVDHAGVTFALVSRAVAILAASKFLLLLLFFVAVLKSVFPPLRMLFLPRFSLLMLGVGAIAIAVPQWREIMLAITEEEGLLHSVFLGLATLLASVTTWYSARVIYMLRLSPCSEDVGEEGSPSPWDQSEVSLGGEGGVDELPGQTNSVSSWTLWWYPRLLGGLVPVVVVFALGAATDWRAGEMIAPLCSLGSALLVYGLIVLARRPFSRWLRGKFSDPWQDAVEFLRIPKPEDVYCRYDGYRQLPLFPRWMLSFLWLLNLVGFLLAWRYPLHAQYLGSAAVVLGGIGLMVPVGNWLVYAGARHGVPALLLLFGLAAAASFVNDNHWVRLSPESSSTEDRTPPISAHPNHPPKYSLRDYLTDWAAARAVGRDEEGEIPLFIVSTEGGGIRAAYWTALVLAHLQESDPRFSDHVFAISGVSGGSLGGAVFAAQVASGLANEDFVEQADAILQRDFLAPTLATLLFPDLLQRFLPWAAFEDRAVTLEKSWEDSWERSWDSNVDATKKGNGGRFGTAFSALWAQEGNDATRVDVPLLFLNSTVVETGSRLIMHPLQFGGGTSPGMPQVADEKFSDVFSDAIDGGRELGGEVPLSTAVHLSARFTYVSPAGSARVTVTDDTGSGQRRNQWVRLVDGGYFENSGSVTARELLNAITRYGRNPRGLEATESEDLCAGSCDKKSNTGQQQELVPAARIRPFLIHISNEPVRCNREIQIQSRGKRTLLGEVLSPLWALLNARPARGYQARDALFRKVSQSPQEGFAHFKLFELDASLPLGWVLSALARDNMKKQLAVPGSNEKTVRESRCRGEVSEDLVERTDEAVKHNRAAKTKVLQHLGMVE